MLSWWHPWDPFKDFPLRNILFQKSRLKKVVDISMKSIYVNENRFRKLLCEKNSIIELAFLTVQVER